MNRTLALWAGAALCASALAGCGGSSSGASTAGAPPAESATADAADDPASADPAAGFTDDEACDWLKNDLPQIPKFEIGAQAHLALGLSTFFEEHGGLEKADGYVFDEAVTRGCPKLRAQALEKAGIKSFGNL